MRFEDFSLLFLKIGKSRASNGKRKGFLRVLGQNTRKILNIILIIDIIKWLKNQRQVLWVSNSGLPVVFQLPLL